MFGADLEVNESAFHAGEILLLKVNFLTLVLLHSKYSSYSVFLVVWFGVWNESIFKYQSD